MPRSRTTNIRPVLLAVPNVSEGRDPGRLDAIRSAFGDLVLDVHADPDHHRAVFTLAGAPGELAQQVLAGAREAFRLIDLSGHQGAHPRVGVLDVAPLVYLDDATVGAACAEALVLGDRLGEELEVPVFLYGRLGGGRTRAELRRGGPEALAARMASGELRPDFGPRALHPHRGAVLLGARPPLIAFNLQLAPSADLATARLIANRIRQSSPSGLPGVRALGLWLERAGVAQVSTNVEDHRATSLKEVVEAVRSQAPVTATELVGLAPQAALQGFPPDVPLRGRRTVEEALASAPWH